MQRREFLSTLLPALVFLQCFWRRWRSKKVEVTPPSGLHIVDIKATRITIDWEVCNN